MKKIKVFLQYPWMFPDSPYYKYLIQNPPKNIGYLNVEKQKGVITSWKKFKFVNKIKNILREILYILKRPNIIKTKKENYDIIHCAHCLSPNKAPWVVDFEDYWNLASSEKLACSKKGKEIIRKFLKSSYCKKILPWTEAAKKSLTNTLNDKEIEKKIEVVYPAIPFQKFKKSKNKEITLLFIGRYFYGKGGLHILEIFDKITKKYPNTNCIFVSEVPRDILKKYSSNKKIKFYDLMPQAKLFKTYSESDIFIYPGYSDTFGFALIEAMSFGLPIVTVDGFARREIILDGKIGYVIDKKKEIDCKKIGEEGKRIIKEMVQKTSKLIENPKLLQKMSKNCINMVKNGKFSIKQRNKKLKKIYGEIKNARNNRN